MKKYLSIIATAILFCNSAFGATIQNYYFNPGTDYIYNWSSSCSNLINTIVVSPPNFPTTLSNDTAYILLEGNYTSAGITASNVSCVGIIGMGNVTVNGGTNDFIIDTNSNGIVIENIKFTNFGQILFDTINSLTSKGSNFDGITTTQILSSNNITIENSNFFNSPSDGLQIFSSNNIIANNSNFYDNNGFGLHINNTINTTINNTSIYKNIQYGLYIASSSSQIAINNSAVFGNSNEGIYSEGSNVSLNNITTSYNTVGVFIDPASSNVNLHNIYSRGNSTNGLDIQAGSNTNGYGTIQSNDGTNTTGGFTMSPVAHPSVSSRSAGTYTSPASIGGCARTVNPNNGGLFLGGGSCDTPNGGRTPNGNETYTIGSSVPNNIGIVSYSPTLQLNPTLDSKLNNSLSSQIGNFTQFSNTPNPYSINPKTCVNTGTIALSDPLILPIGSANHSIIYVTGNNIRQNIDGGGLTIEPQVITASSNTILELLSSNSTGTSVSGTVIIGGFSTDFTVSTLPICNGGGGGGGINIYDNTCGNGSLENIEQCDDGNSLNGDGCSNTCKFEASCGNSVLEMGEQCDDGNLTDGDGCSNTCKITSYMYEPENNADSIVPGKTFNFDPKKYSALSKKIGMYGITPDGKKYQSPYFGLSDTLRWYTIMQNSCAYNDIAYHSIKFSDIAKTDFETPVNTLLNYCIIQGQKPKNGMSKFDINSYTNRADFTKVLVKLFLLGRDQNILTEKGNGGFEDVNEKDWYAPYFNVAEKFGLIDNFISVTDANNYKIFPGNTVTKSEAIALLVNVLKSINKDPGILEPITLKYDEGDSFLTRGEMAELFYTAFSLNPELGQTLKSKNSNILGLLEQKLKTIGISEQKELLTKVTAALKKAPESIIKKYKLFRKGLVTDLERILAGELIPDVTYLNKDIINVLYNEKTKSAKDIVGFEFSKFFVLGQTSTEISILQKLLTKLNLYNGEINGIFDIKTKNSTYQFQLKNGIYNGTENKGLRGILGPDTRKKLNSSLIIYPDVVK